MIQVDCGECSGSGSLHGAYQTVKTQRNSLETRLSDAGGQALFMRSEIESLKAERDSLLRDAGRYRWLRHRNLDTTSQGGIFAGMTPQNLVINEETLDEAIDAAMAVERRP